MKLDCYEIPDYTVMRPANGSTPLELSTLKE